ncbi:MAG: hypothetical protein ACLP9L_35290 [Thermoguttaceae bacterium]
MHAKMELPKAFSVRDEHEFLPIQHLMARLNPNLLVVQVATGVHVNGGGTVFWGLVHLAGEPPSKLKLEKALREAGFDIARKVLTPAALLLTNHAVLADNAEIKEDDSATTGNQAADRTLQDWEL